MPRLCDQLEEHDKLSASQRTSREASHSKRHEFTVQFGRAVLRDLLQLFVQERKTRRDAATSHTNPQLVEHVQNHAQHHLFGGVKKTQRGQHELAYEAGHQSGQRNKSADKTF